MLHILQTAVTTVFIGVGCTVLLKLVLNRCRNTITLLLVIVSGFVHLNYVTFPCYIQNFIEWEPNPGCIELYPVTLGSNTVIILVLTISIMNVRGQKPQPVECLNLYFLIINTSLVTCLLLYLSTKGYNNLDFQQKLSLEIEQKGNISCHLCLKKTENEVHLFVIEYIFLYLPFIWIILDAILNNAERYQGFDPSRFYVLRRCCHDFQEGSCRCNIVNGAMQMLLVFAGICLLLIRPLLIVYSFVNRDSYMDIIPSVCNITIFAFLCINYLYADVESYFKKFLNGTRCGNGRCNEIMNNNVKIYSLSCKGYCIGVNEVWSQTEFSPMQ